MRRSEEHSLLSKTQGDEDPIEALRRVAIYVKRKVGRSEIARAARVDPVELDNFTSERYPDKQPVKYKTRIPSNIFQRNLLHHILTLTEIRRIKENSWDNLHRDVTYLFEEQARLNANKKEDYLFRHYQSVGLASERGCHRISTDLAGSFYGYRLSSSKKNVIKTYFEVSRFDSQNMVPSFKNYRKERDKKTIRITEGYILNLKSTYVFAGFVRGAYDSFVGIKLVIMSHGGFESASSMRGLYVSNDDDGSYDIGRMTMIKTPFKFNPADIGMFDLNTLPFPISELALDLSEIFEGDLREAISGNSLLASLNIDFLSRLNSRGKIRVAS